MADMSGSTRFRALFESALQVYEKKTGITLPTHPLAVQLQSCHSVESITSLVEDQASTFSDIREKDRAMKSVKSTISILTTLSATASLGDAIDLVRLKGADDMSHISDGFYSHSHLRRQYTLALPSYLPYVSFYVPTQYPHDIHMYQAARGMRSSYDALVDLLESVEHFLQCLDIFSHIPRTPALDEMMVQIMMELIFTFALATNALKQGRSCESFFIGVLLYSMGRSEICKESAWRGEHR